MCPGWEAPIVNGTQVTVVNIEGGWVGEFRPNGASLALSLAESDRTIHDDQVIEFAGAAALLGELADEFELPRFTQLGYRETYHFPADSAEDSSMWVRRLGFSPIPPQVFTAFGSGFHAQTSAVVLFAPDCRYRIEVKSMEVHTRLQFGTAEVVVRPSAAKRLGRKELIAKVNEERAKQLNPTHFGQLDLEAFLWDGVAVDHEIADFITRHSAELLGKFRACVSKTET